MKLLSILIIAFILPSLSNAIDDKNPLATSIAISKEFNLLYRVKSLKDYALNSNLTESDRKLFLADAEKFKLRDVPKFKINGTKITFETKKSIFFDYKMFSKKTIEVNKAKISIKEPITYIQARVLVDDIIKEKSASFFSIGIPTANARDLEDQIRIFFSAMISSASRAKELRLDGRSNVAEALMETYSNEESYWKNSSRENNTPLFLSTWTFTCERGKLRSVEDRALIMDGKRSTSQPTTSIKYRHSYLILDNASCTTTANPDGTIIKPRFKADAALYSYESKKLFCGEEGQSIYDVSRAHRFPEVAKACCEEEGCYERVKSHLDKIVANNTRSSSGSPAQSGTSR